MILPIDKLLTIYEMFCFIKDSQSDIDLLELNSVVTLTSISIKVSIKSILSNGINYDNIAMTVQVDHEIAWNWSLRMTYILCEPKTHV